VVHTLLDEGEYLACERTMYRVLAENAQVRERRNQLGNLTGRPAHSAQAPDWNDNSVILGGLLSTTVFPQRWPGAVQAVSRSPWLALHSRSGDGYPSRSSSGAIAAANSA